MSLPVQESYSNNFLRIPCEAKRKVYSYLINLDILRDSTPKGVKSAGKTLSQLALVSKDTPEFVQTNLNKLSRIFQITIQNHYIPRDHSSPNPFLHNLTYDICLQRCQIELLDEVLSKPLVLDINEKSSIDNLAIDTPAGRGNFELVQKLIQYGSPVDNKNMMGLTPMHYAVQTASTNVAMVHLLAASGADLNAHSDFFGTPLHRAVAERTHPDIIQALIECGADVSRQHHGKTPLEILEHSQHDQYASSRELSRREAVEYQDFEIYNSVYADTPEERKEKIREALLT